MSNYIFGIDIGGTTVKLGLFEQEQGLLEKWEIKTRTENHGSQILPDVADSILAKMAEKNITKDQVLGAGVGVPGPVTSSGEVLKCVNLGWDVFNIADTLENLLGMKVVAGNDATVATLGEMYKGGGMGYQNVVMITLGTGVGGGIVIDGNIIYGTTGSAGEIGHFHVNEEETDSCNCGNQGCLEQYASATGIVRMAKKALASSSQDSTLRNIELTAKDIFDAARNGDALASSLVDTYNKYLGTALANVAGVVNPEVFVIGGGVSRAGDIILDGVKKYYQKYAFHSCRNAKFAIAKLGNDAGIYGACKLILNAAK